MGQQIESYLYFISFHWCSLPKPFLFSPSPKIINNLIFLSTFCLYNCVLLNTIAWVYLILFKIYAMEVWSIPLCLGFFGQHYVNFRKLLVIYFCCCVVNQCINTSQFTRSILFFSAFYCWWTLGWMVFPGSWCTYAYVSLGYI